MNVKTIDPDAGLMRLVAKTRPKLSFDESADYATWRGEVKERFIELTGLRDVMANAAPSRNVSIEWEEDKGYYRLIRYTFESEIDEIVPCYLLIPNTGLKKYPVCVTLAGHNTGFHNTIGEPEFETDYNYYPVAAQALSAVKRGFIALAVEQRGLGTRKTKIAERLPQRNCFYSVNVNRELGRTMAACRAFDVMKGIDTLESFPECDLDKIMIMGISGGGTATYYSGCCDERIKLVVPECAFCPYPESIMYVAHCACNYIPSAYKYFDMQDLACLIAPRKLLIVAERKDPIFPIEGVRRGYETVKKIYAAAGAADNCTLVEGDIDHCENPVVTWTAIGAAKKQLGW